MREALIILAVILILLGLTAIRYRKQIAAMIALARALKDAKNAVTQNRSIGQNVSANVQLVNCSGCGVWVPREKAGRFGDAGFICSDCQKARTEV